MKEILELLAIITMILTALVNIAFAVGVYQVASDRERLNPGSHLFVPPAIWTIATLFGGVFVAMAYWLIHLSSLSNPALDQSEQIR